MPERCPHDATMLVPFTTQVEIEPVAAPNLMGQRIHNMNLKSAFCPRCGFLVPMFVMGPAALAKQMNGI